MGGISSSIELAMSGLRATQAGLDVVSQNVANAGSVGYTRRVLVAGERVADGRSMGVDVVGASRMLDIMVQRQLRLEQAGASFTAAKASAHTSLDRMFDRPGGEGGLPALLNAFTSSLQGLANSPSSYPHRATTLAAASDLAGSLNGLARQVADLRQSTESAIGAAVAQADGLLQELAAFNVRIVAAPGSAALEDGRDALVDRLSTLIDIKVTGAANGALTVATTGGLQLVDGARATRLSFDARSPLGPDARYDADPTRRGVGTVTAVDTAGNKVDVIASGTIRSGAIAAQLDLRDRVLVAAGAQLDELAAGLAAALSDQAVPGVPVSAGAASGFEVDLASLSAGNPVTVSVTGPGGAARTLTFVSATSAAGQAAATSTDGRTIGLDISGGYGSVATQIGTALGSGFTVSNPAGATIRILDDGGAGTTDVTALSATATVTGFASGGPELPLFVDGGRGDAPFTGSFEGGRQVAGFASRIALHPAALADPAKLVAYGPGVLAGDATRPLFLLDRLTAGDRSFSGEAGIGGSTSPYRGSLVAFSQRIVETQEADASSAATLDDGQQIVLNAVRGRFEDESGVNIDTELTLLIQLQTAYGANARILTAAKEMMDLLLRIGA